VERGSNLEQFNDYQQKWRDILEVFCKTQCRCEEISRGQRCQNYEFSHIKGHQYDLKGAERVKNGPFKSGFGDAVETLHAEFSNELQLMLNSQNMSTWRDSIWRYSRISGVSQIFSNRTCLTCLSRTPIHLLPCSHCICDHCASTFNSGPPTEEHILEISHCPLGCRWVPPNKWTIRRKPSNAGVRILSLDG
jgi:hypothetical protein